MTQVETSTINDTHAVTVQAPDLTDIKSKSHLNWLHVAVTEFVTVK